MNPRFWHLLINYFMSKTIKKLNEVALENMQTTTWHDEYNKSSYIFVANLNYAMNEGDIAIVFS